MSSEAEMKQYSMVRVRQLMGPPEQYDGWRTSQRAPRVGDIGTLLDILQVPGLPDRYVVESGDADGRTIWLGEFGVEELESV